MKVIARDRLILALDVPSANEAERLMDQVQDQITFVKVGLELYTAAGPEMVQRLIKRGLRVFLDLKFLDIEETVRRATERVASMGGEFLTIHANRTALAAALDGLREIAPSRGKDVDDHARATTPTQTIAAGADYLVIGRPIRAATDPAAAATTVLAEMQAAFDART